MMEIEPPDTHHLHAAQGWIELGNAREARLELEQIAARHGNHPEVLAVRWQILAHERRWDLALAVAEALVELAPASPFGWIHRSFALHELRRTAQAYADLRPATDLFPDSPIIPYNLACYACQLSLVNEARGWLRRACKIGDAAKIRAMALDDPDLASMHKEIAAQSPGGVAKMK